MRLTPPTPPAHTEDSHSADHTPTTTRAGFPVVARVLLASVVLAAAMLAASSSPAHAETVQVLAVAASIEQVLTNIRNWVMGILALLATVFLSIGGVRYVIGSGDPGEIEKAKTAFRAACLGYALAALAPLVVSVLQGVVGA